jgi:hypothetical protein
MDQVDLLYTELGTTDDTIAFAGGRAVMVINCIIEHRRMEDHLRIVGK